MNPRRAAPPDSKLPLLVGKPHPHGMRGRNGPFALIGTGLRRQLAADLLESRCGDSANSPTEISSMRPWSGCWRIRRIEQHIHASADMHKLDVLLIDDDPGIPQARIGHFADERTGLQGRTDVIGIQRPARPIRQFVAGRRLRYVERRIDTPSRKAQDVSRCRSRSFSFSRASTDASNCSVCGMIAAAAEL